ncbi:Alpha/Beta hydrolase protein [Daldinia vernicosa]|uniref:Alpha/Beta hydrolase protein n=1 Tax=Daldinia vernicosa TaxID=114800 RepID=UPI0020084028|nr:Alpha/Beta hydrolase protein [Daldinia vernicosa]KAI0854069.1 Alpha/Beta hydrolase protein [Daldinia vernicosa]
MCHLSYLVQVSYRISLIGQLIPSSSHVSVAVMNPTRSIFSWILTAAIQATGTAAGPDSAAPPTVDLGYATYQGYYNDTYDLNIWKSIRYAAAPIGKLRWQAPQLPVWNNTQVTPAVKQPPLYPQTGAYGIPEAYGFNSGPGDEDCLYLNVYATPNASNLPVLLWIHGGGDSVFGATYDYWRRVVRWFLRRRATSAASHFYRS